MTEEVINPKRFVKVRQNKKDQITSILPFILKLVSCFCQKHSTGHHSVHGHSYYIIRAGECSILYYDDRRRAADI